MENNLPQQELDFLPSGLFHDLRTSQILIENPSDMNGKISQWKERFDQVKNLPPMPPEEATEEADGLSLESFLSRLT